MAQFEFDASTEQERSAFAPLPAGTYTAAIVSSEMKSTKGGDGQFLELRFDILDGQHAGRHLWVRLNVQNRSHDAMRIARQELAEIAKAVGVMRFTDTSQLHNLPLTIEVALRNRKDTGELVNVIRRYSARTHGGAAKPAASNTPPWKRQ